MTPQRVTLITLGVADLERSTAFYAALGWEPKEHLPEARFYQINGMVLGLFGLDNLAKDQGRPDAKLGIGGSTLGQNFPTEAEVDQAFVLAQLALADQTLAQLTDHGRRVRFPTEASLPVGVAIDLGRLAA